jgi:pimeloyl-ACP methyl ester carboxylesterase
VEVTYPRTLCWSLDDYAAAIETALEQRGVARGWLLGESYGSQPLWALVGRQKFAAQGVILAGGFVRHPMGWAVRLAEKTTGRISNAFFVRVVFGYAKLARFRYRRSPEVLSTIDEFVARRAEGLDRRSAQHRLHLIAENDPRDIASRMGLPVFGLTGWLDPVVPWPWVRRWLRKNCPTLRDYKVLPGADHNVLSTAPREAAAQVLRWIDAL